uniref:RanBP2-type domain-containing protein n=1 Tax=Meloidogyne javanica TaxID=6303 RepID=A0A915LUA4_MELJA
MARNNLQSIPGSQMQFNPGFSVDYSQALNNLVKNSLLSGKQSTVSTQPTQFPILPHKEWICAKCACINAKGIYACKKCVLGAGSSSLPLEPVVRTPFGLLQTFASPDPKNFIYDATKGYFHDSTTGGDLELKRSLQEEEFDIQQKRSEKTDDTISNAPSGSLAVQRRSENIADDWIDLIKRVGAGDLSNSAKAAPTSTAASSMRAEKSRDEFIADKEEKELKKLITSNAKSNLTDCILQNEKLLIDLHKLLVQERDPSAVKKIQAQIDAFNSTTRSLQTLLSMLASDDTFASSQSKSQKPDSSTIITPQFKRHITKSIQNEDIGSSHRNVEDDSFFSLNSARKSSQDEKEQRKNARRSDKSNNSLRDAILEGKRTAFDEHIEQVERLRNMLGSAKSGANNKKNWIESLPNISFPREVSRKETSFEDQIRTIVDQNVEKQWILSSSNDDAVTIKSSRQSPSPRKSSSRRTRSRSRHRSRKSRSRSRDRHQRSRSRQRTTNRVSERSRSRSHHRGTFSDERSRRNGNDDDDLEIISYKRKDQVSSHSPQPPPVMPMTITPPLPGLSNKTPGSLKELFDRAHSMLAQGFVGANLLQKSVDQVNPISPQTGFGLMPGISPNLGPKNIYTPNSNQWRMPYQASNPVLPNLPVNLPIICDYCGRDGHSREVCPSLPPKPMQTQDQRVIRNELESTNTTTRFTEKDAALGLCLNCGRFGHSQVGCLLPRITDHELQKRIRKAEDKQRLQQLDKLKLKRKAEKYTVRRNDPFIQRLRIVAPHGKITKEHTRLICQRCSGLGHIWSECARPEAPRTTLKLITEKMEEFIQVFFVHLNDDNLVDFSEKFEKFIIMDGIENNGTVDPVGLQLQTRCNRGVVTKGDLRDLCKNCASLGHVPADCSQRSICSRQHYEKMLKLVDAYRALVKEGNGNFFLPRNNQSQNQQQQPHSSNISHSYSTVVRLVGTKEPEIVLVDSDDEGSNVKRKNGFSLKELQRSILEHNGNEMSSSEPSEFLKGSEVLQIFQQFILPLVDSHITTVYQPTFTLKILFYELLLEMYSKQISENHWPFRLDISNMLVYPLANESTPISLRKIIEQSAIFRINSSEKALEYGNNELINQLAHVLLAADFHLVYMSCTRILSCKNSVNILLSSGHGIPIIQKAKKLKKIDHSFAQLVADLIFKSTNFNDNISEGFKGSFTHTLILSKLAERFLTVKNEGFHYSEDKFNKVLDLLAIVSDYDLNFVGPLLNEYKLFKTTEVFSSFLQQLLSSPKWRYSLNEDALLSFVHCLLDVGDIESTITLFEQYILPYLLESSSAISLLKMLEQQSGGRFLQRNSQLMERICSLLSPVLLLNEKEEICKDSVRWELLDSALQVLSILDDKHNFDNQKLFNRLFEISIGFSNEFLRLPACVLLTRLFKKELIGRLSEVWSANTENEEIKQSILKFALKQLGELSILKFALKQLDDLNVNVGEELVSDSREKLIKGVVALIDYIEPEEEESLNVIKMSVQLCEVLYTDFGKNEINKKLIMFTKQLESMEKRKYERNAYEKNNHKCINELIDDFKNGCNIDNDACGTKDCY